MTTQFPMVAIADFCQRWMITELAIFGSAARGEAGPSSDIDLLATFAANAKWSLLDHVRMEQELAALLGRRVDLVARDAVEQSRNWVRREHILSGARRLYAA